MTDQGKEEKPMDEKIKIDCLLALHKAELDRFMQTRTIEFQVNIAFLTLIVGAGSFLYGKIDLKGAGFFWYSFIGIILFLIHFGWMVLIQNSEAKNQKYIQEYRDEIKKLTRCASFHSKLESTEKAVTTKWDDFVKIYCDLEVKDWCWIVVEVGGTLILLITVGILLSSSTICEKGFNKEISGNFKATIFP